MKKLMQYKRQKALVVVAHTDDETIFFGNLLSTIEKDSIVASLSNRNSKAFEKIVKSFGHVPKIYSCPVNCRDKRKYSESYVIERNRVYAILSEVVCRNNLFSIFTHGDEGEYGHPFHIVVNQACKYISKKYDKPLYVRDIEGEFLVENKMDKIKLLENYEDIRLRSWIKYCKQKERYRLYVG